MISKTSNEKYSLMKLLLQSSGIMNHDGSFNSDAEFSTDTVNVFPTLAMQYKDQIKRLWQINVRKDVMESPVQTLGLLLKKFGLTTQAGPNSTKKKRTYQVSSDKLKLMETFRSNRAARQPTF